MFSFDKSKIIYSPLPIITKSLKILIYDDEPVLYVGRNDLDNYILGSSIDENYDSKIEWHFHTIIDHKTYSNFINRKTTYYSILENSKDLYIIEKSFDNSEIKVFSTKIEDVPEEYRPDKDTYIPDIVRSVDSNPIKFNLSIKGADADNNQINSKDCKLIIDNYGKIFAKPFVLFEAFLGKILTKPFVCAPQVGSFKFDFEIQFEKKDKQLSVFGSNYALENGIKTITENYIRYCFNDLFQDLETIENGKPSEKLSEIIGKFREFAKSMDSKVPDDFDEIICKESSAISDLVFEATDEAEGSYKKIEITGDLPIVCIDEDYRDSIESAYRFHAISTETIDSIPKVYEIHIYQLNVSTRKGMANIKRKDDPERMDKARFRINGDDPLANSKYSGSLHKNMFVQVLGKAHVKSDSIRYLEIVFED